MEQIHEGEVLWIDAGVMALPGLPEGFPLRVVRWLGWGDEQRGVGWVRGVQLDARTGVAGPGWTLSVPYDQKRARRVSAHPVASPDEGLVGPPPGFERRLP